MARILAARSNAAGVVDHLDEAASLFINPDADDPNGADRMTALEEAEQLLREAAVSTQLAREAIEGLIEADSDILREGEPEENEDDEDDEDDDAEDAG